MSSDRKHHDGTSIRHLHDTRRGKGSSASGIRTLQGGLAAGSLLGEEWMGIIRYKGIIGHPAPGCKDKLCWRTRCARGGLLEDTAS